MQITDYPVFLNITMGMSLTALVSTVFNFILMVGGSAGVIMVVWGGVKYLASAGNVSTTRDAKKQIFAAILGLIILFSSWIILNSINPDLVNIREPANVPVPIVEPPGTPVVPPLETSAAFYYIPLGQIIDDVVIQERDVLPEMKDFAELSTQCDKNLCEGGTCTYSIPCPKKDEKGKEGEGGEGGGDSGGDSGWNWSGLFAKMLRLVPAYAQEGEGGEGEEEVESCSASCSASCNTGDPCPANRDEVMNKVLSAADMMEEEISEIQQAKSEIGECVLQEDTTLLSCQEALDMFYPVEDEDPTRQWDEIKNCRQGYDFYCAYGADEDVYLDEIILPFETIKESIESVRELERIVSSCSCSSCSFCCQCCDACSGTPCPSQTYSASASAIEAINELETRLQKMEEAVAEIAGLSTADEITTLTCSEAYSRLKSIKENGCPGIKVFPCCPIDKGTEKIIRNCRTTDFFFCSEP